MKLLKSLRVVEAERKVEVLGLGRRGGESGHLLSGIEEYGGMESGGASDGRDMQIKCQKGDCLVGLQNWSGGP